MTIESDVRHQFGDQLDVFVLDSLISIVKTNNIEPEDLYNKWEEYSTRNKIPLGMPLPNHMDGFRSHIVQKKQENIKMFTKDTLQIKKKVLLHPLHQTVQQTPKKITRKPLEIMSSPPFGGSAFSPGNTRMDFLDRTNKGSCVVSFNDTITELPKNTKSCCHVTLVPGQQTRGYKYLYEKLTERGDLLNDRITFFVELLKENRVSTIVIDPEEPLLFGHPSVQSQFTQMYIGRVSCDTVQDNVTLNLKSIVLETSREIGAGARVKMEFSETVTNEKGFDLFPGQIICVEATNPDGTKLMVSKIIPFPMLDCPTTTGEEYMEYYKSGVAFMDLSEKIDGVRVVVACGPFTFNNSLLYEPLQEFVSLMEQNPPDVIILLGPFVDGQHESFIKGNSEMDVDQVFYEMISPQLLRLKQCKPGIEICLVPSQKDSCHPWVAYPQPPIGSNMKNDVSKLLRLGLITKDGDLIANMFPNPVQFRVNEVLFAVSNNDIILDTFKTHIQRKDRFDQVFKHVLQQRHFYPLFPPSINACLDSTRALASQPGDPCVLPMKPDILILPSALKPLLRDIDGVLCMNPGVVCKGNSGGNFARLDIRCFDTSNMKNEDCLPHMVCSRTRAEISKL